MMRLARDMRLVPLVIVATTCLLGLKFSGLVFDGGYTLGDKLASRDQPEWKVTSADSIPATPKIVRADDGATDGKTSWARQVFNFPDASRSDASRSDDARSDDALTTGSAGPPKTENKPAAPKPQEPPKTPDGKLVVSETPGSTVSVQPQAVPPGERAVLERLGDRRQEIEGRARELDMRENLLKQAEQRLDSKLLEVKAVESKIASVDDARGKAEAQRFKSLVTMYENMKPKDAARIFDRLDIKILVEVVNQINPRKMSDILGQMSSEAAERLTVELAMRSGNDGQAPAAGGLPSLPRIEGQVQNPPPNPPKGG